MVWQVLATMLTRLNPVQSCLPRPPGKREAPATCGLKDSNSEDVDSLSSVHRRVAMTFSDYQFAAL